MDAPLPFAHQFAGFVPFEKYKQPNRTGGFFDAAANNGIDSIHGSASATPAPRRKCRRETG